mmetsp:Transcript_42933/g.100842  ORF Transcript_42933/g.100842 Transcript_42933/m.100842 type:complete len:253 (-) Transcript_42933:44-802(-)
MKASVTRSPGSSHSVDSHRPQSSGTFVHEVGLLARHTRHPEMPHASLPPLLATSLSLLQSCCGQLPRAPPSIRYAALQPLQANPRRLLPPNPVAGIQPAACTGTILPSPPWHSPSYSRCHRSPQHIQLAAHSTSLLACALGGLLWRHQLGQMLHGSSGAHRCLRPLTSAPSASLHHPAKAWLWLLSARRQRGAHLAALRQKHREWHKGLMWPPPLVGWQLGKLVLLPRNLLCKWHAHLTHPRQETPELPCWP